MLQGESSFKYVESSTNAHQGTDVRANPLHHLDPFRGDPFSSKESSARAIRPMRGNYAPGTVLVAEGAHVGAGVLGNRFFLTQQTSVSLNSASIGILYSGQDYSKTTSILITTPTYQTFLCL